MLNRLVEDKKDVCNFLCLIMKMFIYRQRCIKREVLFNHWLSYVKQIERIERYIAVNTKKLSLHEKKWQCNVGVITPNVVGKVK